jgi:very-short-patch-repair endonuclease
MERAIAEIAALQAGQIHRDQLRSVGLSDDAIKRRIASGRLHRVQPCVFSVGHHRGDRCAAFHAAVLTCGDGAALSRRAAGTHLDMTPAYRGLIEVTTPLQLRSRSGIRMIRTDLPADEIIVHDGLPVTSPARTLFDLAGLLPERLLRRAAKEVEIHGPPEPLSLVDLLHRHPRHAGAAAIRALIEAGGAPVNVVMTDTEERFAELVREAGIEAPSHRYGLAAGGEWFEVDLAWPALRLAVECDSSFHEGSFALDSDRNRDQCLLAAGWRVFRVTWWQLKRDPDLVLSRFLAVLDAARRDRLLREGR